MSSDVLVERYGAPAPWRTRALVAAAVVVALAFGGWLAWSITAHAGATVTSEMETWSIDGEHAATGVVVVSTTATDASCRLQAIAEDHSVVGELTFTPDPGAGRRQVQQIRTERRATSVDSLGCTAPGQNRPR